MLGGGLAFPDLGCGTVAQKFIEKEEVGPNRFRELKEAQLKKRLESPENEEANLAGSS